MTRLSTAAIVLLASWSSPSFAQTLPSTPTQPATSAVAQTAPAFVPFPPGATFAFVDFQAVLGQSKFGKTGTEQLKLFADKRDADLAAKSQDVQGYENKLNTQRGLLPPDVISSMLHELNLKQRQLEFDRENWQIRLDQMNQELLKRFQAKVFPVVGAIRAEKNLLMVFAIADAGVVAAHPGLDLSAEVVKRLDEAIK